VSDDENEDDKEASGNEEENVKWVPIYLLNNCITDYVCFLLNSDPQEKSEEDSESEGSQKSAGKDFEMVEHEEGTAQDDESGKSN